MDPQPATSTNDTTDKNAAATFQLRIMTYNIQQINDYLGPKTWWDQANRAVHIPTALREYFSGAADDYDSGSFCYPDILILNEAFNSYAAAIALQLKDVFPYQTPVIGKSLEGWKSTTGTFRSSYTLINGGVTILSRHKIVEQRQHIYTATHASTWDSWANKGVAYARISLENGALNTAAAKKNTVVHIFGTHLQADEGHVPHSDTHKVRMNQLEELRQFIKEELKLTPEDIVIIGGDLNVEYTTESFRTEMECTLQTKTSPYYEHKLPGSYSAPHNWMTKANARSNGQNEERDETLDYILIPLDFAKPVVRNGSEPKLVKVIPLKSTKPLYWRYLANQWPEEKGVHHDLSDHYPVLGTFQFPLKE